MKEPSVTVLIAVKNNVMTIKDCIDSLLNQDYKNYEIFVVDAFSTDGTYEILKKFGKRIKLYQLKGWVPAAYNWAIDNIETEYISLLDGDCTVTNNWLKELIKGFKSEDILEVLGFCATPKNVSKVQKLIGEDLEDRFNHLPEYPSRAPTMNVAFKTKTIRSLRFDESLRVAYDTDFSFRLTKIGKIYYNPKAVIYHHHRATLKAFFSQQYRYGKFMPLVYLKKHRDRIGGDEMSKSIFLFQIIILYIASLSLLFSFVNILITYFSVSIFTILFLVYLISAIKLSRNILDIIYLMLIFLTRNIAWCLGIAVGVFLI